jgi:diguanylate cyclase (GGDEF)-like protein
MNFEIVNMLALGLLVLVFASIIRHYSTKQLHFWLVAWIFVLCEETMVVITRAVQEPSKLILLAETCFENLAVVAFLLALSSMCSEARRRWWLAAVVCLPLMGYTVADFLNTTHRLPLAVMVAAQTFAVIYSVYRYYKRVTTYVASIVALCLLLGASVSWVTLDGNLRAGVNFVQAGLFLACSALYVRRFPRLSVGVATAVAGLVIWAGASLQQSVYGVAGVAPLGSALAIPKYVLAFGMILTLLEEQLQEQKSASEQMEYLAQHDVLTGLPNRLVLEDRLSHALARAKRYGGSIAVLSIDIDRFKQTNDLFGHHVGDICLKEIAARFNKRVREKDTLARTGGDEFNVVLEDVKTVTDTTIVAAALIASLEQPIEVNGCSLQSSASIGIALYPHDGATFDTLCCAADHAMYRAKARGANRFELSTEDTRMLLDVEITMRKALETSGFELMYQPQVRPDGLIAGVEGLLRLRHAKHGLLPPSKFIPIAEDTGLIVPIGNWVLNEACRQGVAWLKEYGTCPKIAVNVSAVQFARTDFADHVESALRNHGFPASLLELELTESIVMNNVAESARQMDRLKKLGITISVDDFGTGYSSLAYLHTLPIDCLKVDRSFVEMMTDVGGTRPIVETILALARGLGLTTVAEGVETGHQAELLKELGCDVLQGFHFFRPMPAAEIGAIVAGMTVS